MEPRVVIVGGGFGGLTAAQALAGAPVEVTLVDRSNHHLFQPLLYQVAVAGLSPGEIAVPIRSVLRRQKNARVLMAEVVGVDLGARSLTLRDAPSVPYDYLIVAAGARTSWFGHDAWMSRAPGLKDLDDALDIRRRVLLAFEAAERELDDARRQRLLSFVVIGGGPTGVELAGAFAELARHVLARDFRSIDPTKARVVLVEAGPRILPAFHERLSASAVQQLVAMGVDVRLGCAVGEIDDDGVVAGGQRISAANVVWAAGVAASPLGAALGSATDRGGRVVVEPDCSVPGHPEVFAIGDVAAFVGPGGRFLPGVSPVAMQQARSVAANIERSIRGQARRPFHYLDKGIMATIGRSRAVAQSRGLRMSGLLAWLAWLFIHIWYLIGFRNRVLVLMEWFWSYVRYKHGARLITGLGGRSGRADH